jgi:LPXTG-motif cell wall-anchored protein
MTGRIVVLLTAAVLAGGSWSAASAATGGLEVSMDGSTWVDSISDPLFDSDLRWVPGDARTASFFVRNQGGSTADLTVDVIGSTAGGLLDSGDLSITATGGGGVWEAANSPGTHRLLTTPDVADGATEEIEVTVAFNGASPNQTQLLAAELTFLVTLTDDRAGGPGEDDDEGDGGRDDGDGSLGGLLPDTGATLMRWVAVIAAILLGTGLAVLARRRTHDQPVEERSRV